MVRTEKGGKYKQNSSVGIMLLLLGLRRDHDQQPTQDFAHYSPSRGYCSAAHESLTSTACRRRTREWPLPLCVCV